jgi:predicted lipase
MPFDLPTARLLANASAAAYPITDTQTRSPGSVFPNAVISQFGMGAAVGYIAVEGPLATIVFQGTRDVTDILADVDATLTTDPNYPGMVHAGFAGALDTVYPQIKSQIPSTVNRICCAGHSLGGALAILAQSRLTRDGFDVLGYSFGSPRVGNPDWSAAWKPEHYRVVNGVDPIPHVPFPPLYKHVGEFIWIDEQGQIDDDPDAWERVKEYIEFGKLFLDWPPANILAYHDIAKYIAALDGNK